MTTFLTYSSFFQYRLILGLKHIFQATLASVGLDNSNSLALHNWRSGDLLVKMKSGGDLVHGLVFQPDPSNPLDDTRLVTCGHRHMTFWRRPDRTHIESASGRFGRDLAGEISVNDVCFDAVGRTIAATDLGHLLVFPPIHNGKSKRGGRAVLPLRTIPTGEGSIANGHDGVINSVQTTPSGKIVVSGGEDGLVRLWTCPDNVGGSLQLLKTLNAHMNHTRVPNVQSLSISSDGTTVLVGTRGGDVTQIDMEKNVTLDDRPMISGHCFG